MVGRAPALLCSIMIGHMLRTQSYVGIIVVAALVIIATGIAFIRRKRIHAFIDRMYEKAVHKQ
jgi:cytochrome c biogenesis protein CcdA